MAPPAHKKLTYYWALFITVFVLHNCEEVFRNLPGWSRQHELFGLFPNAASFTLATVMLTAGAAITGYVLQRNRSRKSPVVLQVFCCIMLFNAASHILGSLYTHTVMPGVLTAIVLIVPAYSWLLLQLHSK